MCTQIAKNAREKVTREFNWETISKNTMKVYKDTIKQAKATTAKVKFEKLAESERLGTATMVNGVDTTITTYTTDSEINILQNPMKKKITGTV